MSDSGTGQKPERKRGSGVQHVYAMLRDEILELVLLPGSALDEVQLAERFNMSRTPIREALVRLAGEGLVETLPNRSTMVSNINVLNLNAFFDAITLMYRVTTRLAAEHHRPADLDRIRTRQTRFAETVATQDALGMIAANREFHAEIALAGRNPYYHMLMLRILDDGRRLLRLYYQSFDDKLPEEYVHEHETMIAAIARRDIAASDALASAHADQIIAQIQRLFASDQRRYLPL